MKKYICIPIAAALLCGCSAEIPQTVTGTEYIETEPITESHSADETSEAVQTEAVSAFEETHVTVSAEATGSYDMPQSFYESLYEILERYAHFDYYDISLAYRDIETGFTVMLDPDKHYYSASVVKAPYMLYIYRLALAGKADLEQKVTYTEKYRREGTGVLKNMEYGTEFTVEELVGYSLEESDNSAFAMLRELFPEEDYEKFAVSLGVHSEDARVAKGQICCEAALKFSGEIYRFIEEKNPYSEKMRYHLTHSRNAMIMGGADAEVVRKYGWYEGFFHDMAVVYGKKTYLLTIMTNLDMLVIDTREYGLFSELSLLFAEYSDKILETENGGDTVIIKIPKLEDDEMILPQDPYMLLSVVNMKLRDNYKSFDDLCEDMDGNPTVISETFGKLGYAYDGKTNQFIPIPEQEPEKAVQNEADTQ